MWGTYGSGDGQFHGPYGVAVDAWGNVYVVDYYNNRVEVFGDQLLTSTYTSSTASTSTMTGSTTTTESISTTGTSTLTETVTGATTQTQTVTGAGASSSEVTQTIEGGTIIVVVGTVTSTTTTCTAGAAGTTCSTLTFTNQTSTTITIKTTQTTTLTRTFLALTSTTQTNTFPANYTTTVTTEETSTETITRTQPTLQETTQVNSSTYTTTMPNPLAPGASRCVIATAAYGSDLAAPVQFLRTFRDSDVESTYLGRSFISAFNAWYYSWAPQVARLENGNVPLRAAVRTAIVPLLGALMVSQAEFHLLSHTSPEAAIVVAGLTASALIGAAYLAVPMVAVRRLTGKRLAKKTFACAAAFAAALAVIATAPYGSLGFVQVLTAIAIFEPLLLSPLALTGLACQTSRRL